MIINLIANSANDAHTISRIRELQAHGLTVNVYGFLRQGEMKESLPITILGQFSNTLGYHKRVAIYYKGLKELFRQPQQPDTLWYYLGLDVAMFASWMNPCKRYIYEECDLTQTYVGNPIVSGALERIDKWVIRHAQLTLMTSEGFIDFHYRGATPPAPIALAPNYLTQGIKQVAEVKSDRPFDPTKIRFAFVGGMRYDSLLSVAKIIASRFPQHEFHFYGYIAPKYNESQLPKGENVFYHGRFSNPADLPSIYSRVDVLLATYDTDEENVKYAEPNKIYEAIYFRKPIIVSSGTFLARKSERLGIGFGVDARDEADVVAMVERVASNYSELVEHLKNIPREQALETGEYIETIKKLYKK